MTKEEFDKFMKAQIEEIKKYKWIQSEKAGKDLGNDCILDWILNHSKEFYYKYFNKEKKL